MDNMVEVRVDREFGLLIGNLRDLLPKIRHLVEFEKG